MGITDASFGPFEIASEPSSIITTSTATMSKQTMPTIRTISITDAPSTTTTIKLLTIVKTINILSLFPIGGTAGIVIGALLLIPITSVVIFRFAKRIRINSLARINPTLIGKRFLSEKVQHYFIATRANIQAARKSKNYITNTTTTALASTPRNLVDIEC